MARKKKTCPQMADLEQLAIDYGVSDNALFNSALYQYNVQLTVIRQIEEAIGDNDPTVTKEYIKGRLNEYMHPAVKELPRHAEAANKTAALLLDIINKLGTKPEPDELAEFLSK